MAGRVAGKSGTAGKSGMAGKSWMAGRMTEWGVGMRPHTAGYQAVRP